MPFEDLKERHAAMWGSAPFERIAVTLAEMHEAIVDSVDGGPGMRWLDVACGTGELAFLAAATVDEFFRIIGSYAPPPPPDAALAASWGEPGYAESLLDDAFEVTVTRRDTPWHVESAEELWSEISEGFGPIKTLLGALEPERADAFEDELLALFRGEETESGISMARPYLLIHGRRQSD